MRARPGDVLVVSGHHLGQQPQEAEVLEARGRDGGPPFLVRWMSDGRETVVYPSSDVRVEHRGEPAMPEPPPARPKRGGRARAGERRDASGIGDPEVRIDLLEQSVDALNREVEELREEIRAIAQVLQERGGKPV
jgi:hypothetical protein